ncbi:WxL domain-containing protein [Pediococcus siamensis]|uniref:WxL domain-containing protein n=1 Tax=Pediococcus siamensis TaxID=381829 RepID=UPI0039A22162
MKKRIFLAALATVTISFGLGLNSLVAHADDSVTKDSVGEFSVTAGSLSLDAVPNFNFGTTDVATLVKGTTLNYQSGANNTLAVSDYRGASDGTWSLTASLAPFKNGKDESESLVAGAINLKSSVADNSKATGATGTIGSAASTVWNNTNADLTGTGTATSTVSTDTTLVTEANSKINSGSYSSTVTWTMANTSAN